MVEVSVIMMELPVDPHQLLEILLMVDFLEHYQEVVRLVEMVALEVDMEHFQ